MSAETENRKLLGLEFSWPIEPLYQPSIYDFYYHNSEKKTISGFTHNNGKLRKKTCTTLATNDSHRGFDIIAPPKTPVFPAAPGYVQAVWNRPDKGHRITIAHETESGTVVFTEYWNLGDINVRRGDLVYLETEIANTDYRGRLRIPHLYLSIRIGENSFRTTIDPLEILPQRDFSILPNNLSSADGFSDSSVALYDEIMKNGWDFKVYVKTKEVIKPTDAIDSIPAGTVLELVRKRNNYAKVQFDGTIFTCDIDDLMYVF